MPVRQLVLSFPIALRTLFAAHPQLLSPLLHIIHRVIVRFLIQQAGLKDSQAHSGAVTLIQRFGTLRPVGAPNNQPRWLDFGGALQGPVQEGEGLCRDCAGHYDH